MSEPLPEFARGPTPVMGMLMVVEPRTVPPLLKVAWALLKLNEPLPLIVKLSEPGFREPLNMPPMLMALFTVTVKVPWLEPLLGPALKQAALVTPVVLLQGTREPEALWVETGDQKLEEVSQTPFPPMEVVPLGFQ